MATSEQIEFIEAELKKIHPVRFMKAINKTQAGIGAVLRLLYESENTVTAGSISEYMNVSTARVAVLLKKMVAKGLIEKENDAGDARVTVVRLSGYGRETVQNLKDDMYRELGEIIDKIGMERMMEFIRISGEIRDTLKVPDFKF